MKTLPKKLLAVSLCAAVSLLGAPVTTFADAPRPDKFIHAANANHWGRSDLRAYLNGVEKVDNTLKCDTTHDTRQTSGYYESQFSSTEYALVQPFTYNTTTLKADGASTAPHSATDRFWLPSGAAGGSVLSWGADDLSDGADPVVNRVVPVSYWSYAESGTWLRSPFYNTADGPQARIAPRGGNVDVYVINDSMPLAAAFKLDVSTVGFASSASAASIVAGTTSGSRKFEIQGSSNFGSRTSGPLPDYGMYLKQSSSESFAATGLSYSGTQLTVNYTGGAGDQYVVVQAFKEDNLAAGTTSYEAAAPLVPGATSSTIDVSTWELSSLDGYTIKVWMEDGSGSLAKATAPVTFVGTSSLINQVADGSEAKNQRVFAEVGSLQTSWGDLQALRDDDGAAYNNVIAGKGQDGSAGGSTNSIHGLNPTNQKIYFGTKDGAPLEFWIAGRETAANSGTISSNGTIMTLYQAKSGESRCFNSSPAAYKNVPTLTLNDSQSVVYDGSEQNPGFASYTFNGSSLDTPSITWHYRGLDWEGWAHSTSGPIYVGVYVIYGVASGSDGYETVTSEQVTFEITKASSDVPVPPKAQELTYTGDAQALVSAGSASGGTLRYALGTDGDTPPEDSAWSTSVPKGTDANTYYVWYKVVGDANYNDSAAACVEVTIKPATLTVESITAENKTYDGTADATAAVTLSGAQNGETLSQGTDFEVDAQFVDGDGNSDANVGTAKQVSATITLNTTDTAKNYTFADGTTTTPETTADISAFDISSAVVELADSTPTYTGTALKPTVNSVKVKLDGKADTTLVKGTNYTVSYKDNTNAGTATVTITGKGNFKDSASTTFTITPAAPDDSELNPSLTATYGQTLGDIKAGLASAIGSFLGVDDKELDGLWTWEAGDETKVGSLGNQPHTAVFTPSDKNYSTANVDVTVNVAQATPDDSKLNPSLTATYGQTLDDIRNSLASTIGSFLDVDGDALEGEWLWSDDATTKVGNVGTNTFTALFAPKDTINYDWTTLDGWDADKEALAVAVAVTVSVDTSNWGTAEARVADGKTQFVDSSGKTSVEISEENLSANDVLWLREESYDTSAWYGIDLSTGAFDLDKGLRLYVRWLNPNDADYAEIYAQLDDAQKARVEADNGWIFLIGIEDPDGNKVQPAQPVKVYVQLGDPNEGADWDLEHLKAYYITSGGDENVPVEDVTNFAYPGGTDEFGMMILSHFSPYFIFDELTDEEKAALTPTPNDNNNQPTDKPDSSGTDSPGTGDISTELLFSGLAIVLVSSLGVMLRLITNKKKFEE